MTEWKVRYSDHFLRKLDLVSKTNADLIKEKIHKFAKGELDVAPVQCSEREKILVEGEKYTAIVLFKKDEKEKIIHIVNIHKLFERVA